MKTFGCSFGKVTGNINKSIRLISNTGRGLAESKNCVTHCKTAFLHKRKTACECPDKTCRLCVIRWVQFTGK